MTAAGNARERGVILAIDPGSTQSGWVITSDGKPVVKRLESGTRIVLAGVADNAELLDALRNRRCPEYGFLGVPDVLVVEWMTSYGKSVGAATFETLWWAGRFAQAYAQHGVEVVRLERAKIMQHLCGGTRRHEDPSADTMIWQVLIDRFGGIGGKAAAVGLKATPGPLYGISSHARAALAVAVTFVDAPDLAHP